MTTTLRARRVQALVSAPLALAVLGGCSVAGKSVAPAKTTLNSSTTSTTPAATPSTDNLPTASVLISRAQDVLVRTKTLTIRTTITVPGGEMSTTTRRGRIIGTPQALTYTQLDYGTEELRLIGATLYVKGDATYWGEYATDYANRWTRSPDDEWTRTAIEDMAIVPHVDELLEEDSEIVQALTGKAASVTMETLDGQRMYCVENENGVLRAWIDPKSNQIRKVEGYGTDGDGTGIDELSGYDGDYSDIVAPKTTLTRPPVEASSTT